MMLPLVARFEYSCTPCTTSGDACLIFAGANITGAGSLSCLEQCAPPDN